MNITWDKVEERVRVDRLIEGMSNVQKYETVKRLIERNQGDCTKALYDPFMLGVYDALQSFVSTKTYTPAELKELFRLLVKPKEPEHKEQPIDPRQNDPEYKHGYLYAKKVCKYSDVIRINRDVI